MSRKQDSFREQPHTQTQYNVVLFKAEVTMDHIDLEEIYSFPMP
jgi:hypothetical protein